MIPDITFLGNRVNRFEAEFGEARAILVLWSQDADLQIVAPEALSAEHVFRILGQARDCLRAVDEREPTEV